MKATTLPNVAPARTHTQLVRDILVDISPLGLFWENNTGALPDRYGRLVRYGLKGSSDILGCLKGRFIGIEVKVGADRQRKEQSAFQRAVEAAGGIYILARSVADVRRALEVAGL